MAKQHHKPGRLATKGKKPPKQQIRRIKVGSYLYEHRDRNRQNFASPFVPMIQLKGCWLEQAGFNIDVPVTVNVEPGRLVMCVEEPN